jgi:hypothetical protein
MGPILILLALHVAASAAGFYWLWRKTERQRAEIARLNELLTARATAPVRAVRAADGRSVVSISELPIERRVRPAQRGYTNSGRKRRSAQTLSPETVRTLVLCLMAVSPALGLFFAGADAAVVASGLAIAAAMMIVALRSIWSVAAWAGVLTATAWAAVGVALGTPEAEPISFALGLALAGGCGLINAHLRRATPGAMMALIMAGVALALSSQTSMFSAPGAAYAIIVAAAAIVGAMSLRLEALHLVAFGAAVVVLYVLSGQESAAIWFTPAAAWAGSVFLAIAAVRVPQLGPRGVALAGTGAFAPLGVITALHDARHGLADANAAGGVFLALALLLCGMLAMAALRRQGGLAALRYTRWMLAAGAFLACVAAITLTLPPQLAAPAFAFVALALAALNLRFSDLAWRVFAVIAALCALGFGFVAAQYVLGENTSWWPALAASTGLVLPALLTGGAAYGFERHGSLRTAACFEAATLFFALGAAHLLVRIFFAGGAPLLQPVSFVEAATHGSLWLVASLAIAARSHYGAAARDGAARGLAAIALAALIVSGVLWLVGAWPQVPESAWFSRASFAFFIPSTLLWAHWWFWRQRNTDKRARVAFSAAAATLAAFVALEIVGVAALPLWAKVMASVFLAATALSVNLLPGVTASGEPLKLREKSPSPAATQAAR